MCCLVPFTHWSHSAHGPAGAWKALQVPQYSPSFPPAPPAASMICASIVAASTAGLPGATSYDPTTRGPTCR